MRQSATLNLNIVAPQMEYSLQAPSTFDAAEVFVRLISPNQYDVYWTPARCDAVLQKQNTSSQLMLDRGN
jgi:hypothetical protein